MTESLIELETAAIWHRGGRRALRSMDMKTAIRWQKRRIWALHREERARRAMRAFIQDGPRCWFCEQPGHDEAEEPCFERQMAARRWQQLGKLWRGKEGA